MTNYINLKKKLTSFFLIILIIFCQQLYLTEKKHIYRGKKKIGNLSLYNKIYMNEIRVHMQENNDFGQHFLARIY